MFRRRGRRSVCRSRRAADGSVSRGYHSSLSRANAHLVAELPDPLNHLRDGILVHAPSRLADGVDDGEVALQRVQGRYGCLSCFGQSIVFGRTCCDAYIVVALHSDSGMEVTTGRFTNQRRLPCTRQTIHGRMSMLRELWRHPTFDVFACPEVGKRHLSSTHSLSLLYQHLTPTWSRVYCDSSSMMSNMIRQFRCVSSGARTLNQEFGTLPKLNLGSVALAYNISEQYPQLYN